MENIPINRDDNWLAERLETIWNQHFADCQRPNQIVALFGRKSRTRLGSIGMDGWQGIKANRLAYRSRHKTPDASVITITGYFQDPRVPDYAIDATLGHELVHYIHGFHSPLPQLYRHPHQGGIVDKELMRRGLGESLIRQRKWLKQQWLEIIGPTTRRRRVIKRRTHVKLSLLHPYFRKEA